MSEPAKRFLFGLIWPKRPASGRKHTLVERLTELRDAKNDFLADEEYAELRSSLLGELTGEQIAKFPVRLVFIAFIVTGVVGIFYCLRKQVAGAACVPAMWAVAALVMWWRMERNLDSKRNLSRADRLTAVDELAAAQLITPAECSSLKTRINELQLTTDN